MRAWFDWPLLAAALLLLNASLTFVNVWPTPKIRWSSALAVELAVVVAVLALLPRHAPRLARGVVPVLWVALVLGRYLDVTGPGLYGREFNLYWDSQHLGNVAAMLARAVPVWQLAVGAAATMLGVAALWFTARAAWTRVGDALSHAAAGRGLLALSLAVLAGYGVTLATGSDSAGLYASPVSRAYARQARYVAAMATNGPAGAALSASPDLSGPLTALGGADVLLTFVEAYGAVTYDNPAFAAALQPRREDLDRAAGEAGRVVLSAFVESPTFGASSWLAHLSLLTGVETRDQYAYVSVMASGRDTLPRAFRRQGYRSIALMPGMRQAWPEGDFYGFSHIYGRDGLAYQGPRFGWWSIPDQFTLARLDALERTTSPRPPLFVTFPTSTTHAPFGPVPPYQPDWAKVLTPTPFDPEEAARALAANPVLTDLAPSYVKATAYALATFAGYVREHAGEPLVFILVGDHQPVAAVSGPDASLDVPVHIVLSPGAVAHRLRAAGFADGVTPPRRPIGRLHALAPILMRAFGED